MVSTRRLWEQCVLHVGKFDVASRYWREKIIGAQCNTLCRARIKKNGTVDSFQDLIALIAVRNAGIQTI